MTPKPQSTIKVPKRLNDLLREKRDHIKKESRLETLIRLLKQNVLDEELRLRGNVEEYRRKHEKA